MKTSRNKLRLHRKRRIRSRIFGTAECPRISVFKSLKSISAQVIDDGLGRTLAFADLGEAKAKNDISGAGKVGRILGEKCVKQKIKKAVFDRGGYKYHGKIKALAEGAREAGLKF